MKELIKLIIVDDHPLIRTGIRAFLDTHKGVKVVKDFGDGFQALDYLKKNSVDLVLLDLNMPNIDGLEVITKIQDLKNKPNVLLFSHLDDEHSIKQGMALGATGYLVKDAPEEELLTAIKAVGNGGSYLGKNVYQKAFSQARDYSHLDELTEREEEVLYFIAKGYSNRQIAKELIISEATVKTHVSSILKKLEVDSRTQAALHVIRKE